MAELFKDQLSYAKILELAEEISIQAKLHSINLPVDYFQKKLPKKSQWVELTLMERLRAAAAALYSSMPASEGADIVVLALRNSDKLTGWLSLVCCEYVVLNDNVSLEHGLLSLQKMTEFFSAEFAIRHYILNQPKQTLVILSTWLNHENHHVRRLISEGTRPRLPWGVRLPIFIERPDLAMPLLAALKDDEEEYVRRSVANHLNDIAKDHPAFVIETAQSWLSEESLQPLTALQKKNRTRLVRHACRTLFKQGNPRVMELFGYLPPDDVDCRLISNKTVIPYGGDFEFELRLDKKNNQENLLMVDYAVHFQKANGKQSVKVFKWLDRKLTSQEMLNVVKKHSFKRISTRRYYPGLHTIEVIVNGIKKARIHFEILDI